MNHNGGGPRGGGGRNAKRPRPDGHAHSHADRGSPHKRARENNRNNRNPHRQRAPPQPSSSAAAPNLAAITELPTPLPPLPPINDPTNATLAFTHTSVTNYATETYDRLEWYGDSVIEMAATDLLWDKYPSLPGGRLSQIREALVNNARLAAFARGYGFDDIVSGSGADKNDGTSGGSRCRLRIDPLSWANGNQTKILGDVFEAYIGAVALEDRAANRAASSSSAIDPVDRTTPFLRALWTPSLLPTPSFADEDDRAQEAVKAAASRAFAPSGTGLKTWYEDVGDMEYENKAQQRFRVAFYVRGWGHERLRLGEGVGQSKKVARARAAQDALDRREREVEVKELAEQVERYLLERKKKREAEEAEKAENGGKGEVEVERDGKKEVGDS
ncbi:nucleolar rnase [Diplodia corticola]|uniref:Nucleolar rnase n=1 Tax=Diplodia corticola TaxID=236234 RepID=A0A1J9RG83_9PEZI|nr:nucleolar rnase [Diplodia corticola]OJD39090.1 nucleolar rnase [Diplodia corticola]